MRAFFRPDRGFLLALSVLLAGLALPLPGMAQQRGAIAGTVRDSTSEAALSNVAVEIVAPDGSTLDVTYTGPNGEFRQTEVAAGTYTLRFSIPGWLPIERQVTVEGGRITSVTVHLEERSYNLNPITVTASKVTEKILDAPASVEVVRRQDIEERPSLTIVDQVKEQAAVDFMQTGLRTSYVVVRGFNNIFSGATLTLTDNRIARVPSLRVNISHLNPTTNLDLERIEVVLGPGSALYGPNAANGVIHAITKSPIDEPGASFSAGGGLRQQQGGPAPLGFEDNDEGLFHGEGRLAVRSADQKFGFKVSGQYFTGTEFLFIDPEEAEQQQIAQACSASGFDLTTAACRNFSEGLDLQDPEEREILVRSVENVAGGRDNDLDSWALDGRLDWRPTGDPDFSVVLTGGRTVALSSVDLTGLGAAQVIDWAYNYGQLRVNRGDFFGQLFFNKSDNDESFLLRSGRPLTDASELLVGQLQHATRVGDRQNFIYGFDLLRTVPKTRGTINGKNEGEDDITEVGGYVQSETALTDRLNLVLAARFDHHSRLDELVFSPRAALVFQPDPSNSVRLTYNRAFGTPTTLNLFLDISGGSVPIPGTPFRYDIRATGGTEAGFTFPTGPNGLPMHMSPFNVLLGGSPRQFLPTTAPQLWAEAVALVAAGNPQAGQLLSLLPAPTDAQVGILPLLLDLEAAAAGDPNPFRPFPGGLGAIGPMPALDPTITNTAEVGYKGLFGDDVRLQANVWYSHIQDFISALRLASPHVFLSGQDLAAYITPFFVGLVGQVFPDEATARAQAAALAQTMGSIPLGVVTPEEVGGTEATMALVYRNLGNFDLFGMDAAATFLVGENWELEGSLALVSDYKFRSGEEGDPASEVIPLNAPTLKGAGVVRYRNQDAGVNGQLRFRAQNGFPANSAVFVGDVAGYGVVDFNVGYRLPGARDVWLQLDIQNALDNQYRTFVGAPRLGRVLLARLRYDFRPF